MTDQESATEPATPYKRRRGDIAETVDHRKISLLTTIRALCVVIVIVMAILAVVLGYTLSAVNSTNDATYKVTSIICSLLKDAPIEIPPDCKAFLPDDAP